MSDRRSSRRGRSVSSSLVITPEAFVAAPELAVLALLDETLRATKGNKALTARLLGIDVRTVSRKLERLEESAEPSSDAGDERPV